MTPKLSWRQCRLVRARIYNVRVTTTACFQGNYSRLFHLTGSDDEGLEVRRQVEKPVAGVGAAQGMRDWGRAPDGRSCAHADLDSAEVVGIASDGVYEGQERHSHSPDPLGEREKIRWWRSGHKRRRRWKRRPIWKPRPCSSICGSDPRGGAGKSICAPFSAGSSCGDWRMDQTRRCSFHRNGNPAEPCNWTGPMRTS